MKTEVAIGGQGFLVNGKPTYEGVYYQGTKIEGLLLNSRMIQAVFDDECRETVGRWRYPDTETWSPMRNTEEFCNHLPLYREHGLLAVTVGLQGGGSVFSDDVYPRYVNSAYRSDGSFKQPYFARLERILSRADAAGMVVIVNLFYKNQMARLLDDDLIPDITERVTERLLRTGYRNIIVDVVNEAGANPKNPYWARSENVHSLIEIVQGIVMNGHRLPACSSSGGGRSVATGRWLEIEDVTMPHGNGLHPEQLMAKIKQIRDDEAFRKRPRPIVINEDSIFVENMEAAVAEYASWGFYCQGYGSGYKDRMDWTVKGRESAVSELSGYQTVPVNWGINTPIKRRFFGRLKEITQGQ